MEKLTVGELADRTHTTRRALRLYEEIGILTPEREPNGYRIYTEEHVEQVLFIRALRTIGATLNDLREFYAIKDSGLPDPVKHQRMIEMIDRQIEILLKKRDDIDAALAQMGGYRGQIEAKMVREDGSVDDGEECDIEPVMLEKNKEDGK